MIRACEPRKGNTILLCSGLADAVRRPLCFTAAAGATVADARRARCCASSACALPTHKQPGVMEHGPSLPGAGMSCNTAACALARRFLLPSTTRFPMSKTTNATRHASLNITPLCLRWGNSRAGNGISVRVFGRVYSYIYSGIIAASKQWLSCHYMAGQEVLQSLLQTMNTACGSYIVFTAQSQGALRRQYSLRGVKSMRSFGIAIYAYGQRPGYSTPPPSLHWTLMGLLPSHAAGWV